MGAGEEMEVFMSTNQERVMDYALSHMEIGEDCDVLENDCRILEYVMEQCEITVPEDNRFFVEVDCSGILNELCWKRADTFRQEIIDSGLMAGNESLAYTGTFDISHTTPEWELVIDTGFVGIRNRVLKYAEKNSLDAKKQRFYNNILSVYDKVLLFVERAAKEAEKSGRYEMAEGLYQLAKGAPRNLYEAMQMSIGYYVVQHMFEGTYLRSLGRIDKLFYPYYVKEKKETAEKLMLDYLHEIDRLKAPANIPFAIGGTDLAGKCMVNDLSYMILEAYKKAGTNNTKFHILCCEDIPEQLIKWAFEGIREGNNSIVFLSDKKIIEALEKMGEDREDAVNYHIVGCYECGGNNELTCTCNGRVSLVKALEFALNNGRDMLTGKLVGLETSSKFETYEELYKEFKRQLAYLCECSMKIINKYEGHYKEMHAAPILSATYTSALEKGGDLYCDYTAKYNNSSINAIGLATAADSLAAIKKMVFEDRLVSLERLQEILRTNWAGEEKLRLFIKKKYPKYGMGDAAVDAIAGDIVNVMAEYIDGKPNVKGGQYRLGLISINWRWEFGEKAAASADGRLAGETVSQNVSATFGADREGATAHLLSTATIDYTKVPNGTVVDIDLHSSAVRGESGINMLTATLKTYFELGGFGVHYNVLDTEVLKAAKENPEKYPNLQVRLCGWNVLFSSLSDAEKDEFIERSMR